MQGTQSTCFLVRMLPICLMLQVFRVLLVLSMLLMLLIMQDTEKQ